MLNTYLQHAANGVEAFSVSDANLGLRWSSLCGAGNLIRAALRPQSPPEQLNGDASPHPPPYPRRNRRGLDARAPPIICHPIISPVENICCLNGTITKVYVVLKQPPHEPFHFMGPEDKVPSFFLSFFFFFFSPAECQCLSC